MARLLTYGNDSEEQEAGLDYYADISLGLQRCMFIRPCNSSLSSQRIDINLMVVKGHFSRDQSRLMLDSRLATLKAASSSVNPINSVFLKYSQCCTRSQV